MPIRSLFILLLISTCAPVALLAQLNPRALDSLPEAKFENLSDRAISQTGRNAMAIRPSEWKHGETEHFVYHYLARPTVTPVASEAEFYYRILAKELQKETTTSPGKSHIFIYDRDADWEQFVKQLTLDPWTGGLHVGNELFIRRVPGANWENRTLGHEVTHLVLQRFFGNGIPLWLNEGYAEYSSLRGFASYMRARNYLAKPISNAVSPDKLIPIADLVAKTNYPAEPAQVSTFYDQSEKLVRFLAKTDSKRFLEFFEAMARGARFDTALGRAYGTRFNSVSAFEQEFRQYATKDFGTTIDDRAE